MAPRPSSFCVVLSEWVPGHWSVTGGYPTSHFFPCAFCDWASSASLPFRKRQAAGIFCPSPLPLRSTECECCVRCKYARTQKPGSDTTSHLSVHLQRNIKGGGGGMTPSWVCCLCAGRNRLQRRLSFCTGEQTHAGARSSPQQPAAARSSTQTDYPQGTRPPT